MKVAFLGPEGTYTHRAAEKYFNSFELAPKPSLREVVEADADAAVIPFENSIQGAVGEAIDLLHELDVVITGEQEVEIDHVLASESPLDEIEKVRSHPQALSQCREFLDEKGWEEIEASSTARATQQVDGKEAAICSRTAARLNDLKVLEQDIQQNDSNITRFLIIGGEQNEGEKTSLILEPENDRPGLLADMLSCFSSQGINLSYIQSRPTKQQLGNYFFYVEVEAPRTSKSFQKAVKCLKSYTSVELLGSYNSGEQIEANRRRH